MCLKSYFKEIVLKLATNGQNDKGFLLTSTFVPKGLSVPALGLYTCIKALNIYQDQVSGERLQDHWLDVVHGVCVPFLYGVLGKMWNSIISAFHLLSLEI